eukprot:CAMPEP_0180749392 /NCGR_PEP_ID=MMETSP1038_2-20121128/30559_1 /TAXON_ID=632150 /ORGANISM="Azadinium spinosum, Strain 3D9" /LENGTH=185 /DNA_ID=CAMNT_0022783077 /DNA_START=244 /DNA_END=798 /DNA_ORIENTATION=+
MSSWRLGSVGPSGSFSDGLRLCFSPVATGGSFIASQIRSTFQGVSFTILSSMPACSSPPFPGAAVAPRPCFGAAAGSFESLSRNITEAGPVSPRPCARSPVARNSMRSRSSLESYEQLMGGLATAGGSAVPPNKKAVLPGRGAHEPLCTETSSSNAGAEGTAEPAEGSWPECAAANAAVVMEPCP